MRKLSSGLFLVLCILASNALAAGDYSNDREKMLNSLKIFNKDCEEVKFHKKTHYERTQNVIIELLADISREKVKISHVVALKKESEKVAKNEDLFHRAYGKSCGDATLKLYKDIHLFTKAYLNNNETRLLLHNNFNAEAIRANLEMKAPGLVSGGEAVVKAYIKPAGAYLLKPVQDARRAYRYTRLLTGTKPFSLKSWWNDQMEYLKVKDKEVVKEKDQSQQ